MAWIVLVLSGLMEAVWATALDRADGFTRLVPSGVFALALVLSMAGLGWSLRTLPVGTAYAVWVGIGAVTTVLVAMLSGAESFSVIKALLLAGIIGCVIGLKVVG